MTAPFTYEEGSIVVRLLIAHCLTDFFWQSDKWVIDKKEKRWKSKYLGYHALITGIVAWISVWNLHYWPAILILTISHFVIDGMKLSIGKILAYWKEY